MKNDLGDFNYNRSANRIYSIFKHSAKKRNIGLSISKEDFISWYNQQEQKCYYCERVIAETKKDVGLNSKYRLTIDRKNNNVGYELKNIVLACWRCNKIKSDTFSSEEMIIIVREILNKR